MTRQQLLNIPNIHEKLTFGKFKGMSVLDVLDKQPSYLVWCVRNVPFFKIDEGLKKELIRQYEEHLKKQKGALTRVYMRKYSMHATEADDFLEFDVPKHF